MPNSHDRFNIEVLKLLLKLAWQDGELAEREQLAIFALGRSWTVPEAELTTLREQLKSGTALPEPDLETLKERPDDVLMAARALAATDGKVDAREAALIARIEGLLRA